MAVLTGKFIHFASSHIWVKIRLMGVVFEGRLCILDSVEIAVESSRVYKRSWLKADDNYTLASCMDLEKFARVFLMRKWGRWEPRKNSAIWNHYPGDLLSRGRLPLGNKIDIFKFLFDAIKYFQTSSVYAYFLRGVWLFDCTFALQTKPSFLSFNLQLSTGNLPKLIDTDAPIVDFAVL